MRLPLFLLFATLLAPSAVLARDIVITRGAGRDCYVATLQNADPGNDARALVACNEAVSAYAGDTYNLAASLANRAEIWIRMGRYDEAVADSGRSIALVPDLGAALINRGAGLVGQKRYGEAIASLDRAIALGGEKLELAYYNRGLAKDYEGDLRGAWFDYNQALALKPDFALPRAQLPRFKVTYKAAP